MLGIIGGSGLYDYQGLVPFEERVVKTKWGDPSAPIIKGSLGGGTVLFLCRHGRKHTIPPHKINYRANVEALMMLGAKTIISTTAVGGIQAGTGDIVIPDQIIDYTYGREHTFSDSGEKPIKHIDFTEPYSPPLRKLILQAANSMKMTVVDGGTYGATQGPRLETAAVIHRLTRDGCKVVGMTGMPEAALARELDLEYATISLVVNQAAGIEKGHITMERISTELKIGMNKIEQLIENLPILLTNR